MFFVGSVRRGSDERLAKTLQVKIRGRKDEFPRRLVQAFPDAIGQVWAGISRFDRLDIRLRKWFICITVQCSRSEYQSRVA
mmetsp:Transcript_162112/g.519858  ORF Transcript_162112/g.519858 Transcript_162112/m.519858 type:complete len:81 (+) Transcript_162112:311-553(+)